MVLCFQWSGLTNLKKIVDESNQGKNNPTTKSLMFMLNHMVEEYGEYKKLGSVEELAKYKEIAIAKGN